MAYTVLIVDDHPSFRASARIVLESEGFDVVGEAEDGASAITQCCRLRPQVVLLDVQLPDTDGFDVCAQLIAQDASQKVILTSSRDSSDFGPLVHTSGARGFVPKAELSGERVQELL
jgi:DNA-binding NarL/FixJ family response regulator